jgi:flagella basal body P-ring formation protein FlgA
LRADARLRQDLGLKRLLRRHHHARNRLMPERVSGGIQVQAITSDITVVRVNRSLARGTILNERDLQELLVQRAPGHLPIINHIEEAIGTALKRPLREGTELQHSMLQAPVVIKRGEQTVIEAGNGQFTVRMTGKALQDGAIGEQIRVQNIASKRTIQGEVQANGSVAIMQW